MINIYLLNQMNNLNYVKSFVEDLQWKIIVHDIMPGTEEQQKEMTTAYIGFDPTSDLTLHIGSLVPIILLVHLERAGHKPVALVG